MSWSAIERLARTIMSGLTLAVAAVMIRHLQAPRDEHFTLIVTCLVLSLYAFCGLWLPQPARWQRWAWSIPLLSMLGLAWAL
jgi:hypothetical protein